MWNVSKDLPGPSLLTQGLCVLLVSFPVHHGWICDGQFAVVLLSDNWPSSPMYENGCDWGEKNLNKTLSNSCEWRARGFWGKGETRAQYSLAVGTSLSTHVCLPEGSNEFAPALTNIFHLLRKGKKTLQYYFILLHSCIHSLDSFYYFISLHHIFILWFLPFFKKGVSYPLKHFPQNPNIAKLYQLLSDFFKA